MYETWWNKKNKIAIKIIRVRELKERVIEMVEKTIFWCFLKQPTQNTQQEKRDEKMDGKMEKENRRKKMDHKK